MQPGVNADPMMLVKTLAVLAVCGAVAAKFALDRVNGTTSRASDTSGGWSNDWNGDGHHDCGGHDGSGCGDGDGGH